MLFLPNATSIPIGWEVEIIISSDTGQQSFLKNHDMIDLAFLNNNKTITAKLTSQSDVAGVWNVIGGTDPFDPVISVININTTTLLYSGVDYHVDSSGGSFIVSLPNTPINGAQIRLQDPGGTWAANPVTVAPAVGDTIMFLQDYKLDYNCSSLSFFYDDSTHAWNVEAGPMIGATQQSAGILGEVPTPAAGEQNAVLTGGAVFSKLPLTIHSAVTSDPAPAVVQTIYSVDTSNNAFNFTLPDPGAYLGQQIQIIDSAGSFGTHGLTLLRSGTNQLRNLTTGALSTNAVLHTNNQHVSLIYSAINQWDVQDYKSTSLPLSGGTMSGPISMGTHKIVDIGNPTELQDAVTKNYADVSNALKVSKNGDTMTGPLNMSTNKVISVGDPVQPQDVATKNYVDSGGSAKVAKGGDTMTGSLNMSTNKIISVGDPVQLQDVATKNYVDVSDALKLAKTGDTMTGVLNMSTNLISSVGEPVSAQDVATKNYVDIDNSRKVSKAGDTMDGDIDMAGNKISSLADPVIAQDAATKKYTDTADALKVTKGGDTMTGPLNMSTNLISSVGEPVLTQDAATKNYVDNSILQKVSRSGDTIAGEIIMSGNKISSLGDPTAAQDATTKKYVSDNYVDSAGDTITGGINMSDHTISSLADPVLVHTQ